jgi:hypothetical protein
MTELYFKEFIRVMLKENSEFIRVNDEEMMVSINSF